MTQNNQISELTKALVRARSELRGTVFKGGYNQAQRYAFVGHEQVIVACREELLKHGLVLEQRHVEFMGELVYRTSKGESVCWRWRGTHALVHESGEERSYVFEATTGANDKAAFVASTSLDRTAHLRVMELAGSSEEDPEHDSHDQARPEPAKPSTPPPKQSPRADASAYLDAAFAALQDVKDDASAARWFRNADAGNVEQEAKTAAFKAWSAKCKELGIDAKTIAIAVRRT